MQELGSQEGVQIPGKHQKWTRDLDREEIHKLKYGHHHHGYHDNQKEAMTTANHLRILGFLIQLQELTQLLYQE